MKEKIIEIIRNACALEEKDITLQTKLKDLSLDSLSFIEAIVKIEQTFDIEFEFEQAELSYWESIGDIILKAEELSYSKLLLPSVDCRIGLFRDSV